MLSRRRGDAAGGVVPEPVIEVRGLTKVYRSGIRRAPVHAVKNLALTVPRGAIVAFVGPNGAGKTTTIHTLLGFLKPNEGSVRIFGMSPAPVLLRRIGYQSEIFHPYPFYKAREALRFYGRLSGMTRQGVETAVPALLERVGLREAANRTVGGFSKGMTQRLGLAQALLHDPELLILDEPTSGLDPEGRRLVLDIIREEKARGRTVFLSSHILSDVERTCDEVIMIRRGEVAFSNQIADFGSAGEEWEIEVLGWTDSIRVLLGDVEFDIVSADAGAAVLVCGAAAKKALLHKLTSLPVDISSVQRRRSASLEETYLKHLERA
jgi:ABC-2 type transport system ATP-binding protein